MNTNKVKFNEILDMMIREYQLEQQYGHLSCFDFPHQYDEMDELGAQIEKHSNNFTADMDITANALIYVLESVVRDLFNNEIKKESIRFYQQYDFINLLATKMLKGEKERFKDMLAWMDEKPRSGYLETRFIFEFENDKENTKEFYYDSRMSFVVIAEKQN